MQSDFIIECIFPIFADDIKLLAELMHNCIVMKPL